MSRVETQRTRWIELRVGQLARLFESLDPSPFREQDLAADAEQYIVDSAKELAHGTPIELRIYLDAPSESDAHLVEEAIHSHFARHAMHLRRVVRDLLRDGFLSLLIGLVFLGLFFVVGQAVVRLLGMNPWSTLARESLLIGGWVAMWRPLEIFLYTWWPLVRDRRLHERLSQMPVRITVRSPAASV